MLFLIFLLVIFPILFFSIISAIAPIDYVKRHGVAAGLSYIHGLPEKNAQSLTLRRTPVFCDVRRQRGVKWPPGISRVLEYIATKFQRLHLCFRVKLSSSGTSDFVGRRRVPEIQYGSQQTGSTDISETMTYTMNIPTTNLRHSTMANSQRCT